MKFGMLIKHSIIAAASVLAFGFTQVNAAEVAGVKIDDTLKVGGVDLKLNGAGVRVKAVFKVYVAGLYLTEKKNNLNDIMALNGPKRIQLTMMRSVTAEQFGNSFMDGLNHNNTKAEKTKIVNQMLKFGEMFASIPELQKGDVITVDWIPNVGSVTQLNGKKTADPFPDVAFFNALMKIWLGEQPAYAPLKNQMLGLGDKPASDSRKEN
jgi:hypothetical protein